MQSDAVGSLSNIGNASSELFAAQTSLLPLCHLYSATIREIPRIRVASLVCTPPLSSGHLPKPQWREDIRRRLRSALVRCSGVFVVTRGCTRMQDGSQRSSTASKNLQARRQKCSCMWIWLDSSGSPYLLLISKGCSPYCAVTAALHG